MILLHGGNVFPLCSSPHVRNEEEMDAFSATSDLLDNLLKLRPPATPPTCCCCLRSLGPAAVGSLPSLQLPVESMLSDTNIDDYAKKVYVDLKCGKLVALTGSDAQSAPRTRSRTAFIMSYLSLPLRWLHPTALPR